LEKLLFIAVAIIVLQVPLYLINAKRDERAKRHDQAVAEVTSAWGREQTWFGPILVVPFKDDSGQRGQEGWRVSPSELTIEGVLDPHELRRGIFKAQVYQAELQVRGRFDWPESLGGARDEMDWTNARLVFGPSHSGRFDMTTALLWNETEVTVEPGTGLEPWFAGVHAAVPISASEAGWTFDFGVSFRGSGGINFSPLAQVNRVVLESAFNSPSFVGALLPSTRVVEETGFEVQWDTGALSQAVSPGWVGSGSDMREVNKLTDAKFGVVILPGVTDYRAVERAVKYGILFLVTIFTGCFLSDLLGGRSLHLLNYLLVGSGMCLFFLALLALAELMGFSMAYLLAAGASTMLVVGYAHAVMGGVKRTLGMAALLSGIFGYLYLVLRMEDLSLISGTVLLFVLLGAVMYATRHLSFDKTTTFGESGETRAASA
jgi:inner membrane protein